MLRDKHLIPLSRQHQHALALCVRIDRALPIADSDAVVWQAEISQLFQSEIGVHFAAEERVLFPAARKFAELVPLVEELISEHAWLRHQFERSTGGKFTGNDLAALGQKLSAHIRKEERQLFERMQALMGADEMAKVGQQLETELDKAIEMCVPTNEATRLRGWK